jgi:hypothetical protein
MITYINATINGKRFTIDAITRNEYQCEADYLDAISSAVRVWRLKYSGNFTVRSSRRRCKVILNAYL